MPRLLPLLLLPLAAIAADEPLPPPDLQPTPDGAPEVSEEVEPTVTITRRKEGLVSEYRVNGRLYMVRVEPDKGVPYYLVDTDGDGQLDVRYNDLHDNIMIPGWVIMSW
ncbi:MAG: DUF2782 domain-containing protein [Candidatus Competibacteraceae bacterium]|nr:DUF2782 domain-containing protein [Candidatus Competibacteraceae bacterium]